MSGDEKAKQVPGDAKAKELADWVLAWQREGQAIRRAVAEQRGESRDAPVNGARKK
jgi:hypothetical protein